MSTTGNDASTGVGAGFSSTATDYEAAVRHNIAGGRRLVMSIPEGGYRRLLDVGCGTGWTSLAMVERFPTITHITGIDVAQGMLDVFRTKAPDLPGVDLDLRVADVMDMGVAAGAFDVVVSSMAMHWFADKPGAATRMADALAPGGTLAILCSGTGGEGEFREVLATMRPTPPPEWDAAFDFVQRDVGDMEDYLLNAGLEPLDIWMERRVRHSTVEAYLERVRVVAGHITAQLELSEDRIQELWEGLTARMNQVNGPRGFRYTFTKLYAVARKPA